MLRDSLRPVRNLVNKMSTKQRAWSLVGIIAYILFIGGVINLTPWIEFWPKFGISVLALIIALIVVYTFFALKPFDDDSQGQEDDTHDEVRGRIPPMPSNPPMVSAEKSVPSDEIDHSSVVEPNSTDQPEILVDTYQRRLSLVPLLFQLFLAVVVWLIFLYISIISNSPELWVVFVITTIVLSAYCYYRALVWNGEDYIVNEKWVGITATLPWPLPSREPQILRTQINSIEIVETMLDKLLHTCQLKLKTEVSAEQFEHIRWLTHPDELRRALGKSTPRKNHFLFWLKRKD